MEDNKPEEQKPELQYPRLVIEVQENGTIKVSGSINDKVLAYGLLESAKDAIKEHLDHQSLMKIKHNGHNRLNIFKR